MQIQIQTTDSNTSDLKVEVEGKTFEVHFDGGMEFSVTRELEYADRWGDKYQTVVEYNGEFDPTGVWGNVIDAEGELVEQVYAGEVHDQLVEAFEGWANDHASMLEDLAQDRI